MNLLRRQALFLSMVFGFFGIASAQSLDFNMVDDTLLVMTENNQYLRSELSNTETDSLYVDIIRVENDIPGSWFTGLCIDGNCQYSGVDSFRVVIPPLETREFRMYFAFLVQQTDTAHTYVLFRNVNNHANQFSQHYYATTHENLGDLGIEASNYCFVAPNPFQEQATLDFNFTGVEQCRVDFYDLRGRRVHSIEQLTNGTHTLDLSFLRSGQYFFKVFSEKGSVLSAGKVVKD